MDGLDGSPSNLTQSGSPGKVQGYGITSEVSPSLVATAAAGGTDDIPRSNISQHLMEMDVRLGSRTDCAVSDPYQFTVGGADKEHHICFPNSEPSIALCYGDSGGPLTVKDSRGLPWVVGVTSRCSLNIH